MCQRANPLPLCEISTPEPQTEMRRKGGKEEREEGRKREGGREGGRKREGERKRGWGREGVREKALAKIIYDS